MCDFRVREREDYDTWVVRIVSIVTHSVRVMTFVVRIVTSE